MYSQSISADVPPAAQNSSTKILLHEKINFTGSITVTSNDFIDVDYFKRTFYAEEDYTFVDITYNIPFVGRSNEDNQYTILLNLDGEDIDYEKMTGFSNVWQLRNVRFNVKAPNLWKGYHILKIRACVDEGGTLYIPCFCPQYDENTKNPKMFASLTVVGFK